MCKRIILLITMLVALISCSSSNNSGGGTNGALSFNQSSYQIASDGSTEVILSLKGSNSTTGVNVAISSSNNNIAVVTQSECVLSDESGYPTSCEFKVKNGSLAGTATIIASAPGVATASATISVPSSAAIPGVLAFSAVSESATVGSDTRLTLSLNGSSGVDNLVVQVLSSAPLVANPLHSTCVLSTLERTCTVIVDTASVGNATISASATGYTAATNTISVNSAVVAGTLSFDGNKQIQVGSKGVAILSLSGSSGVESFVVGLSTQNGDATISPINGCILSSAKPLCYITITGVASGSDNITATATGYADAGMVASVTAVPVNGNLYFNTSAESVAVNAYTTVRLMYTGGSGVSNLPVTLSTNNGNVTISRTTCPMNNIHGASVCDITVSGISQGQTTITAKATGYPDVTNTVNVLPSGSVVYGSLKLLPANSNLLNGANESMILTLVGSSNVNSLVVNLATAPSGIVTLGQPSCTLSTLNNSCPFSVTGASNGSTVVTASASQIANPANASVTVTAKAETRLVFNPDVLILSNQNTTAQTSTLTLVNPPVTPVSISFSGESEFGFSPGNAILSKESPTIVVNINNATIGGTTGTFAFTAAPVDIPTIANGELPVIIAPSISVPRTITVINMCPFTVYAGISGGSANLTKGPVPGTCPTGTYDTESTDPTTGYELCYWNNPTPSTGSYKLTQGESTQFVIPTSSVDTVGAMWGGGIMARLKLNESWVIGQCNAGQESLGGACAVGVGFSVPETVAEITMISGGQDTYDLQLINGVTVPISMAPNGVTADSGNPYINGVAGSTSAQTGTQYTLKASSWTFDPSSTGVVTATTSSTYYNYVSGTSGSTDQCTTDTGGPGVGCTGNANGPVCGYAANSLANTNGNPPTYARVCGYRLAYLTGAAIYTMNPSSSNTAPFSFESLLYTGAQSGSLPYPNANSNPMHDFYLCNNGAAQSGYQAATVYPQACGCANWDSIFGPDGAQIATPTKQCQGTGISGYSATTAGIGFNSAWLNEVLPRVQWVKQGAPTAYSFPYDDPSSTFSGYQPASSSNAANAVNYTVTFCPGGKTIPNYNPNLQ